MSTLRIALLLSLCYIPAVAQEQHVMAVGRGVMCDTPQQIERFATLRSDGKDADVALRTINNGAPDACSFGLVAFTGGAPVAQLSVNGRPVSVVEITVHAFSHGSVWKAVPEAVRYTLVMERGLIA